MARFLFIVPPLTGHVNPAVSVAHHLCRAGHEVAWVGYAKKIAPLLPASTRLLALDDREYAALEAEFAEDTKRVRLLESLVFLWERFLIPLTHLMLPGVEAAIDEVRPDALVVDQQALAGAFAARDRDLPWATLVPSAAEAVPRSDPGARMIWDFVDAQLEALQRALGREPIPRPENSPELVLVFSSRAFFGEHDYPATFRFVGPALSERPAVVDFPWDELRDVPRVLVSLGTVNPERGRKFYRAVTEALGSEPLQVILSAPRGLLGEIPANFLVRDYVPQLELLPHLSAVLCHAGHNTVAEALSHGLPLVMTPIRDDQPIVASLVERVGAGIRLRFGRLRPQTLRDAVRRVLDEPDFREAAARIRASYEAAGGAPRAAELLTELAAGQGG